MQFVLVQLYFPLTSFICESIYSLSKCWFCSISRHYSFIHFSFASLHFFFTSLFSILYFTWSDLDFLLSSISSIISLFIHFLCSFLAFFCILVSITSLIKSLILAQIVSASVILSRRANLFLISIENCSFISWSNWVVQLEILSGPLYLTMIWPCSGPVPGGQPTGLVYLTCATTIVSVWIIAWCFHRITIEILFTYFVPSSCIYPCLLQMLCLILPRLIRMSPTVWLLGMRRSSLHMRMSTKHFSALCDWINHSYFPWGKGMTLYNWLIFK